MITHYQLTASLVVCYYPSYARDPAVLHFSQWEYQPLIVVLQGRDSPHSWSCPSTIRSLLLLDVPPYRHGASPCTTLNRSALLRVWMKIPTRTRSKDTLTLLLSRERTVSEPARNLAWQNRWQQIPWRCSFLDPHVLALRCAVPSSDW